MTRMAASAIVDIAAVCVGWRGRHARPGGWTRRGAGLVAQAPLRSRSPDRLCHNTRLSCPVDRSVKGHPKGRADQRVTPSRTSAPTSSLPIGNSGKRRLDRGADVPDGPRIQRRRAALPARHARTRRRGRPSARRVRRATESDSQPRLRAMDAMDTPTLRPERIRCRTALPLTRTYVVETMGLEPTTPCLQSRCSSQLSYVPQ
jgi:hypothetical protein